MGGRTPATHLFCCHRKTSFDYIVILSEVKNLKSVSLCLQILHYVQDDNCVNTRRRIKKTPSHLPQFFFNFSLTLLQEKKIYLQLLSL